MSFIRHKIRHFQPLMFVRPLLVITWTGVCLFCRVTWGVSEFCRRNGRPSWRLSSCAPCLMMASPSTSSKTCLCWPPVLKTGRTQCFMESLHLNGDHLNSFDYKWSLFLGWGGGLQSFWCDSITPWSCTYFVVEFHINSWTRSPFLSKVQRCIWKLCSVLLHYGPGGKGIQWPIPWSQPRESAVVHI